VKILGCSGLSFGEVSVSHVVVPGCWDRSTHWWVAMTFLVATFRIVTSLSTFASTGATRLDQIRKAQLVKTMLKLSHDAMDMLPSVLVFHIWRVPDKMT
jgi:hypothetical protein